MSRNKAVIIYISLALLASAALGRVVWCEFISGDDPLYVTENTHIMNGVTWEAVRWAFTNICAHFWHPLTMISLMLDFQLFGLNPHGYHLTNLLLHIASTLLLFSVLHRMTKAPWKSAFVAALFAVHPLNVESVAWVAERKNVLSTFFWMLTMVAYASYATQPRPTTYLTTLALFVMGLMAKPMLVTFPFVMLLLDYWPLQRFGSDRAASETRAGLTKPVSTDFKASNPRRKPPSRPAVSDRNSAQPQYKYGCGGIRQALIEKIPFLALIVPFSLLAYISEGEAVNTSFPWNVKVSNAIVSYVIYIGKMFWPSNLAVFYPHPGLWPFWQTAGAALLLVVITGTIVLTAKKSPYLITGWLWFVGTLVPVIGIVQISGFGRADRFTYIPMIGLFVLVAWGVPELLKGWRYRAWSLIGISVSILFSLSTVTWIQAGYWLNSFALYDHSLEATSRNYHVHVCRGAAYAKAGNYVLAIKDYNKALSINPEYADAYYDLGTAYEETGDPKQAISYFDKTIKINPNLANAYNNRGYAYASLGEEERAIQDYEMAIAINPESDKAYSNRGLAYFKSGNYRKAIMDYDLAIRICPKAEKTYWNRGNAYLALGNEKQAVLDYDHAIEINPNFASAYYDRGIAYRKLANYTKAMNNFNKAIELNPRSVDAYFGRGNLNCDLGNYRQAISDYDKAIEMNPKYADAYHNRGIAYAKVGNWERTIEDLKTAAQLGNEAAVNYLKRQGISW